MNAKELILLNFAEVRRRSIRIWKEIPADALQYRPDEEAMTCIEMVRHVLESENIYHHLVLSRGSLGNFASPIGGRPFSSVDEELRVAQPYRERFLQMVNAVTDRELDEVYIERKELNQKRKLGDYLLRIAYHESVHAGQLLGYLRNLEAATPNVWD